MAQCGDEHQEHGHGEHRYSAQTARLFDGWRVWICQTLALCHRVHLVLVRQRVGCPVVIDGAIPRIEDELQDRVGMRLIGAGTHLDRYERDR